MRTIVRQFREGDLEAVIELSLRAWAPVFASFEAVLGASGVYARMYPDWRTDQRRAVEAACHADGMNVQVAVVEAAVAGFAAMRLDHQERVGEIHMIAVDPAYQRNGVGGLLTAYALRWFTDNGMALAMVETGGDPGHAPARHTYQRAGFVEMPIARYFKAL